MSDGLWVISMSGILTVVIVGFMELIRALRKPLLRPLVKPTPPMIDSKQ